MSDYELKLSKPENLLANLSGSLEWLVKESALKVHASSRESEKLLRIFDLKILDLQKQLQDHKEKSCYVSYVAVAMGSLGAASSLIGVLPATAFAGIGIHGFTKATEISQLATGAFKTAEGVFQQQKQSELDHYTFLTTECGRLSEEYKKGKRDAEQIEQEARQLLSQIHSKIDEVLRALYSN